MTDPVRSPKDVLAESLYNTCHPCDWATYETDKGVVRIQWGDLRPDAHARHKALRRSDKGLSALRLAGYAIERQEKIDGLVTALERAKPWLFNAPLEGALDRWDEACAALAAWEEPRG